MFKFEFVRFEGFLTFGYQALAFLAALFYLLVVL